MNDDGEILEIDTLMNWQPLYEDDIPSQDRLIQSGLFLADR